MASLHRLLLILLFVALHEVAKCDLPIEGRWVEDETRRTGLNDFLWARGTSTKTEISPFYLTKCIVLGVNWFKRQYATKWTTWKYEQTIVKVGDQYPAYRITGFSKLKKGNFNVNQIFSISSQRDLTEKLLHTPWPPTMRQSRWLILEYLAAKSWQQQNLWEIPWSHTWWTQKLESLIWLLHEPLHLVKSQKITLIGLSHNGIMSF